MNNVKLDTFVGEILWDIGACYGMGLVRIGGELVCTACCIVMEPAIPNSSLSTAN